MEDTAIINLWKTYDKKLQESLVLNKKNAEEITRMKVHSFLVSMKPLKIFTLIVGTLWVAFVSVLIGNLFPIASPFFILSAGLQALLTALAIGIYLHQVILLHQVGIVEPIIVTQERIANLKSSTIWVTRLLFLQLPLWTTFYWNESMLQNGNGWLYLLQGSVTALFTYLAIWLFINIKYENSDKKWFRLIFNGKEWAPIMKATEMLSQLSEYKK